MIQGLYWGSFGAVFAFASAYLLEHGLTNSRIGAVIALGSVLSAILQPLAGAAADRSRRPALHRMMILFSLAIILTGGILLPFGKTYWAVALFYGLLIAFVQVMMPLANAIGMFFINRGVRISFGICRGIGSVSYGVVVAVLGMLAGRFGTDAVIWAVLLLYGLMIPAVALFHFKGVAEDRQAGPDRAAGTRSEPLASFLAGHRRFAFVLAGNTLVFISYNILGNYLFQIIAALGGGSREVGFAGALAAGFELPVLFLLGRIGSRFRSGTLLKLSEGFMLLKAVGLLLAKSIGAVYAVMCMQLLGYGLFAGISVFYVSDTVGPENQVRGQSLMTMTITAGMVLGSLLGGLLLDRTSVRVMLAAAVAFALAGAAAVFCSAERGERRAAQDPPGKKARGL